MEAAVKREKSIFIILAVIASLFWLVAILGTFGIGLLYLLVIFLFYVCTHSALIGYLKGNSVRITAEQFPDIHEKIKRACEKLKMPMPEAYLQNGNGILNAFATKFLGRNYVVLLSDVVDAFDASEATLDFYIGHELGHIHRKHLVWWPFILPASFLPLLYPAYRRACEFTCDQYGQFCCEQPQDAVKGLSLLASGPKRWRSLSTSSFLGQLKETGGFWMSFHELTGTYPWLTKRVARVQEAGSTSWPSRHPLSWVLGIFCPGFLSGALFPIVFLYVGIFAFALVVPRLAKMKKAVADTQAVSQTVAGDQVWVNPLTGHSVALPPGVASGQRPEGESEMVLATFTANSETHFVRLMVEELTAPMTLDEYSKLLMESKTNLLKGQGRVEPLEFVVIGGVKVASSSFSKGGEFDNLVHVWTHDEKLFWHTIESVKVNDAQARKAIADISAVLIAD